MAPDQANQLPARRVISIFPSPRKPGRFEVEIDGMPTATVSIEAIERFGLATGAVIDDRAAAGLEREVSILQTYDRALNMLAARGRASAELRRLLIRKGEPAESVDVAIERLVGVGFLDDAAFARQFARSKGVSGGLSRRRLQQELGKRGVNRETGTDAIETVFSEEGVDEAAAIERVAQKKLRSLSSLDAATKRRRLYSFLARRGYDSDDIGRVTRQLLDSSDETEESI
jgi:regulatory protein